MSRAFVSLTKSTAKHVSSGRPVMQIGGGAVPSSLPSTATVAANVATLVADGATPTQAHVNTLNTNWGTLLTALNAMSAETGDVYLSFDTSKIASTTDLLSALDKLRDAVLNAHLVTAS